jgi:DNA-binding CsgD family transcriptional regulator
MLIDRFLRGGESSLPAGMQLSPRELEVLREVASGSTNAVVAERLSISVNTVVRHLTHIYTKTGTTNRLEAVRLAEQRGLVD